MWRTPLLPSTAPRWSGPDLLIRLLGSVTLLPNKSLSQHRCFQHQTPTFGFWVFLIIILGFGLVFSCGGRFFPPHRITIWWTPKILSFPTNLLQISLLLPFQACPRVTPSLCLLPCKHARTAPTLSLLFATKNSQRVDTDLLDEQNATFHLSKDGIPYKLI